MNGKTTPLATGFTVLITKFTLQTTLSNVAVDAVYCREARDKTNSTSNRK